MTFGPHILKQKTTQHTYFPHQLISIVSRTPFAMHRQTNHLYKKRDTVVPIPVPSNTPAI